MKRIYFLIFIGLLASIYGKLYAQADAIVKKNTTKYTILGKNHVEITDEYELIINTKKGMKYASFYDYYDKFKKIKQLEMIILDRNGNKIKKLRKGDAFDVKFANSYETDDSRILALDADYQQLPFTIKVYSKSVINGFISLPPWMPRFDYGVEVESAVLELEYPLAYRVNIFEEHITKTSQDVVDSVKHVKWEISGLDAISKVVNKKTFHDSQPKVLIAPYEFEIDGSQGSFESWESFGNWFLDLNANRDSLLADTKVYLDSLKMVNNSDLIRNVYHYMQDKTRYVSIQLGIGGYQTIPSDVVESTGYGDCKALTNYMKAMLDYVEIPAYYILVRAGAEAPDVKKEFLGNQFNHVFLGVPLEEDTVLLECTSQMMPSDYIGKFTDDRNVLWIRKNDSKIIKSRKYAEDENTKTTLGKVEISAEGHARMLANTTNTGIFYDDLMRYKHVTNEDAKQYHYNSFTYKDYTINDLTYSETHRDSVKFNLEFDLTVNNLTKRTSDKMLIPYNLWLPVESYLDIRSISSSVDIKRGFRVYTEFEVSVPAVYWQKSPPEDKKINTEFGSYNVSVERIDDGYLIRREVLIKKGFYQGDTFELFDDFLKKIKRADNKKIVLDSRT